MTSGFDMMKLFQEAGRLQEKVSAEQNKLAGKQYEGEAGAGMGKVLVNGLQEVVAIHLEPDALKDLGIDAILELIASATNVALQKARDGSKTDMMQVFQEMAKGFVGSE